MNVKNINVYVSGKDFLMLDNNILDMNLFALTNNVKRNINK